MTAIHLNTCIVCSNDRAVAVADIAGKYRITKCPDCGFEWVDRDSLAVALELPNYDDYRYSRLIGDNFEDMKPYYKRGLCERLISYNSKWGNDDQVFADIGCANGEYLWAAKQIGFHHVFGVEIDSVAAEKAQRYGDIFKAITDIPEETCNVVQIKNVASNIKDLEAFVSGAIRLLKPNGFLLFDVLNQQSLTSSVRLFLRRFGYYEGMYGCLRPPYVINGFSIRSTKRFLTKLGLRMTLCRTASLGSLQLPYRKANGIRAAYRFADVFHRGAMIITNSLKQSEGILGT